MSALRPDQILRILEITDSFNLHRESIFIPLRTEENGSIMILPDGRLRIVCPEAGQFAAWLVELRGELERIDLSKVKQ
ncbi:MAG: hypothetical protein ABSC50_00270 [Candidatus Bathyarchaeia archaeon]